MRKIKRTLLEYVVYWTALIAMFFNSSSFWCSSNSMFGVCLAVIGILVLLVYRRVIMKKYLEIIILFIVGLGLNILFTGTFSYIGMNLRFLIVVVFAMTIALYMDMVFFQKSYVNTMVVLTVIALVVYFFVVIQGQTSILRALPTLTNANGVTAYNGVLFCVYTYRFDRLMSIFWEPSVYSTFANIALLFLLVFEKNNKINFIKSLILFLGILASKSTGGYLLLIMILCFFCMISSKSIKVKQLLMFAGIILSALIVLNLDTVIMKLIELNPEVFYKLDSTAQSGSLTTRMDSGRLNMSIFLQNPITGVGLGKVDSVYVSLGGKNETSTLTYFLAAFGFWGIMPTVIFIRGIFRQKNYHWIYKVVLVSLFLYILLKEPYWFSCGMYTIVLMFFFNQIECPKLEIGVNK